MASPSWLEELRGQLQRQALPPQYVARLLQEVNDHFRDLQEERGMEAERTSDADARMGRPDELAAFASGEYRRRSFSRKHPVVTFAVLPPVLLLGIGAVLWVVAFVIGGVVGEATGWAVDRHTERVVCHLLMWLPVALTAVVFCRAALRWNGDWRWSLLTAATLAVFPGMTVSLAPSMLMIGFLPPRTVAALIQVMLPLAIGGWYAWRGHRLQSA